MSERLVRSQQGEALIDVFRHREDDGAHWKSIGGTWYMPIGTILIFSLFRE